MQPQEKIIQEKAILAGLNSDVFTAEETATEETMDELEALLETPDPEKRRRTLEQAGKRLARRLELSQQGAACLLACAQGLLPRIGAVLESGAGWQALFPILD